MKIILCLFFAGALIASGKPRIPLDSEVLETLPAASATANAQLRSLRAAIEANPLDENATVDLSRYYMEKARLDGDPRYIGYAETVLLPWEKITPCPLSILLMQGTLDQSNHRFDKSAQIFKTVLERDPANIQAHLTLSTICTLQGHFEEGKRHAAALFNRCSDAISLSALLAATTSKEEMESAIRWIHPRLNNVQSLPDDRVWALTILGEKYLALGDTSQAGRTFKEAMEIHSNIYLLSTLADLLIAQERWSETVSLLASHVQNDALLLRLCMAEKEQPGTRAPYLKHAQMLEDRYHQNHLKGNNLHIREEALFLLNCKQEIAKALLLARENWGIQKEFLDIRLFLDCAVSARNVADCQEVVAWIKSHRYEDVRLEAAINRAQSLLNPVSAAK